MDTILIENIFFSKYNTNNLREQYILENLT